jgi:hypothetical protein
MQPTIPEFIKFQKALRLVKRIGKAKVFEAAISVTGADAAY